MKKLTIPTHIIPNTAKYGGVTPAQIAELFHSFSPLHRRYTTVEQLGEALVNHIYRTLRNKDTGMPQCSLVRMFHTCAYKNLSPAKQTQVGIINNPENRVMELLATRGQNLDWNSPATSISHRLLPLRCREPVPNSPIITTLVDKLGISMCDLAEGEKPLTPRAEDGLLDIFYVEDALGNPTVPAQDEFVIPYNIRSIVAFGGLLDSHDIFVSIMFFNVPVSSQAASEFRKFAEMVNELLQGLQKSQNSNQSRKQA